jgi:hypothetical protein
VIRRNSSFKTQFFFPSKNDILEVRYFYPSQFYFSRVLFVSGILGNVPYKNSASWRA